MRILYFVEYNDEVYAYYCINVKMTPHGVKQYDQYHKIIKMEEYPEAIKKKYAEISYRLFNDDRITKFIKAKIKHYDGPFSLNSDDLLPLQEFAQQLVDIHPDAFLKIDHFLKDSMKKKAEKMRAIIIKELTISRDLIESPNNWQLTNSVKEYHHGRIDLLKQLLETTM